MGTGLFGLRRLRVAELLLSPAIIGLLCEGGRAESGGGWGALTGAETTTGRASVHCPAMSLRFGCDSAWVTSPPERRFEFLLDYEKTYQTKGRRGYKEIKLEPDTVHS